MSDKKMLSYIILSMFIFLLINIEFIGVSFAEKKGTPKCSYEVDKPGDGPPPLIFRSFALPTMGTALFSASAPGSTKTFRTDTGPELDFYQPCNGGDNEIDFNINVYDVDVSSIESATLTLAVWDVDFDCGISCCERDSVYINGHRLTTPVEYLTGADGQWSTVTFNVDPIWIIDGDNYIQIFIDLFCPGYWCVTCDWGELTVELEEMDLSIESKDISISPKSWWEFWKKPFDISAEVHNNNDIDITAEDVEVKFIKKLNGQVIKTETKTINEIDAGESGTIKVDWNLDFNNDIEIIVDPDDKIDENDEDNNDAVTTKINGTINNSANQPLSHLLVTYQEQEGTNWNDKVYVFTNNQGKYYILNNLDSITEGAVGRINISLIHSPSEDINKSVFRIIDELTWGNNHNPVSETAVSKQSNQWNMDKNVNRTINLTVADNEGGIAYKTMATCYNYHKNGERAPLKNETLIEINDNDHGAQAYGDYIHLPSGLSGTTRPSAIGHEYTHVIEQGWDIAETYYQHDPQYSVEEGSAHWGSCKSRNSSTYQYPSNTGGYTNIDISNDGNTNGGNPAPNVTSDSAKAEFQIAGTMWDLNETHVWDVLHHGGFWAWSVNPDKPIDFYTYYIDRDSRTSPTIKNIFRVHGYQPYADDWPGKDGEDPDNFTGNYSDEKVDLNGDGIAEYLKINVELNIENPGYYYVFGEIKGLKYAASKYLLLPTGIQTVSLQFYGEQIYEAELNGPYIFSGFLADENFNNVDYRLDTHSTLPYNHVEFKQPNILFTGNSSDYGFDENSDGLYDLLKVDVEVNVLEPGEYKIYGNLYANEDVIGKTTKIVTLANGINIINLDFEGKTIRVGGFNGPYSVALSIPRGQEINTSAYSYEGFQPPGASFVQVVSDSGVDEGLDGLFDTLEIEISLNCNLADNYLISGHLYDSSDRHITSTNVSGSLIAGIQNVKLGFDGISIRNEGKDGPYNLRIELKDNEDTFCGRMTGNTSVYDHTQFQISEENYFNIGFTDHGTDNNNNGLYEYLTLELNASSTFKQGDFRFDGYLYDENGNIVSFANTTANISNETSTVQLNFIGQHIWATNITEGSYYFKLKIYNDSMELITLLDKCHTTSTYNYIEFEPPQASFSDNYSDSGLDTNNDGLYEYLVVNVGINVAASGSYTLEGYLYDINTAEIVIASNNSNLNSGFQLMQLNFDGATIREHGVDGPYILEYLKLYYSDGSVADQRNSAYTTSQYSYLDFQAPPVALTGNYTDSGTDTNSDGIYEYLTVNIEVSVLNAGSYALNARIMDINENEIVWASTTSWLPAGQNSIMQLNFNGEDIYDHGIDGPYYIRDVYVYNMADTSQADSEYNAHITNAYNYWEFGNLMPVADAGGPYSGEVDSPIIFNASASYDPDGSIVSYEWDFNDDGNYDEITTAPTISYTYSAEYNGLVKLKVTDNEGLSATDTTTIEIVTEPHITGDLDGDGDIDRDDINIIKLHLNQPASVCPECDIDGDGTITGLDARKLVIMCTCSRCLCP